MNDHEKLLNEAVDLMRALTENGVPLDQFSDCHHCGGGSPEWKCKPDCPYLKTKQFLARDEIAGRPAG